MSRRNAPENFFFRGTGSPTAVRKKQPLVPRSNLGGKVCARTDPWFRGQTLLVSGHGGGRVHRDLVLQCSCTSSTRHGARVNRGVHTSKQHGARVPVECVHGGTLARWAHAGHLFGPVPL